MCDDGLGSQSREPRAFSIVNKDLTFTPAQLPATIYANNEISCGNSYSTLWHVTAYLDSATPIGAGGGEGGCGERAKNRLSWVLMA